MAAAEARAAWQRTANRCFMQEDAKRAPKWTCCPNIAHKSQNDPFVSHVGGAPDHPMSSIFYAKWNSSNNFSPDTKWWLQEQPTYANFCCGLSDAKSPTEDLHTMEEHESQLGDGLEFSYVEGKSLLMDEKSLLEGYQKYSDDVSATKTGENYGPWWRTADETELATLVAIKSLEHVENCDLPPPRLLHTIDNTHFLDPLSSSYGGHSGNGTNLSKSTNTSFHVPSSKHMDNTSSSLLPSDLNHQLNSDLGKMSSSDVTSRTWSETTKYYDKSDGNKAQLLEALCHSQTRAREAEEAAAKALSDKEKLIQLLFKEASHLFAYRQWLRMLQLETFCLQIKLKEQPVTWEQVCALIPWRHVNKDRRAASKAVSSTKRHRGGSSGKRRLDVGAWTLAMALGIGLAGAGLFLGWTMGWLLCIL